MTTATVRADRRMRRIALAVIVAVVGLMGLAFVYSHERTRVMGPQTATPATAAVPENFDSYERRHSQRDEARAAQDQAAYEARQAAHAPPGTSKP